MPSSISMWSANPPPSWFRKMDVSVWALVSDFGGVAKWAGDPAITVDNVAINPDVEAVAIEVQAHPDP